MGGNLTHPETTASTVTKKLLQELVPGFVLPASLGSDNDLNFVANTYLNLAKILLLIGNGIVPIGHKAQER